MRNNERGAAFFEFAAVLPVLLLVVFGIIQFGLILNASITLNNAAEVGARAMSLRGGGTSEAEAQVKAALQGSILEESRAAIAADNSATVFVDGNPVNVVQVQIQYNYPLMLPYVLGPLSSITLNASANMER